MKIDNIQITNFKGIKSMSIKPAKINIIVGKNGSGKSSILQALHYGLTGNYPPDAIAGGCNSASVEMEFPDIGLLKRTMTDGKNEVRLNNKVTSQSSISDLFSRRTGVSSDTAEILTSADTLINMTSAELSSYFLSNNLLNVGIGLETLIGFCNLSEAGKKALQNEIGESDITVDDIDRIWNEAKTKRKFLKRDLKEATIKAKYEGDPIEESAEDVSKKLRTLLQRQGELRALQKSYEQTLARRNEILKKIEEKKKSLQESVDCPDETLLDRYAGEIEHIEMELSNLKALTATIKETGMRLKKILDELALSTCPISAKLTCTTDKSPISTELNEAIKKARVEYKNQQLNISSLEQQRSELQRQRKALEQQKRKYDLQMMTKEQIEYLMQNLPEEPQKPSNEEMQQILCEVDELNRKQTLITQYLNALDFEELREKLAGEVETYEEIVRELDPRNGIRQKILERSLKPLEDYFNASLEHILTKYRVRLDCSKGFSVKLIDGEREYDAAKSASGGERCRIWFVLMDLINALSSYRIMVYDNTDGMDTSAIEHLIQMLASEDVQSRYDHIFVSMIDFADVQSQLKEVEGINVIRLEEPAGISMAA